jgi:hypothetical protein
MSSAPSISPDVFYDVAAAAAWFLCEPYCATDAGGRFWMFARPSA